MSAVDIDLLRQWVGKTTISEDVLSVRHARLMAATLGQPQDGLTVGSALPPLWHWIYFLEGLPPSELGRDGHPALGGFLPPVPLPNRMWAGGTVQFLAKLPLGLAVQKRSTIQAVEHKTGRSGELVFVTVKHEVLTEAGEVAINELHDIVYKAASGAPRAITSPEMPAPQQTRSLKPDSTLLMRYSALTFNGHRIHYDVEYARNVEGYPDLVIHGPLSATLLAGYAQEVAGRPVKTFRYRGIQPSILGTELTLNAAVQSEDRMTVWTTLSEGGVSMQAEAEF